MTDEKCADCRTTLHVRLAFNDTIPCFVRGVNGRGGSRRADWRVISRSAGGHRVRGVRLGPIS